MMCKVEGSAQTHGARLPPSLGVAKGPGPLPPSESTPLQWLWTS